MPKPGQPQRKRGRPAIGIAWAASKLGVNKGTLWRVIHGHKSNPALLERFHQICPGAVPYIPSKTKTPDRVNEPQIGGGEDAVRTVVELACAELSRAVERRRLYQTLLSDFYGLRSLMVAIEPHLPPTGSAFSISKVQEMVRAAVEDHEQRIRILLTSSVDILRLVDPACSAYLESRIQADASETAPELALEFLRRGLQGLCEPPPTANTRKTATKPKKRIQSSPIP